MKPWNVVCCVAALSGVTLWVSAEPSLVIYPVGEEHTRALGHSVVFKCIAKDVGGQDADPDLRWFDASQGQEITDTADDVGSRVFIGRESPGTLNLYIVSIRETDAGIYTCIGVSQGEREEKHVELSVFQDITFDHAPSPQYLTLHTDGLVECEVSGNPAPEIYWRYRGERIYTGAKYTVVSEGLRIWNVTEEDIGEYICRAEVEEDGRLEERRITVELRSEL